jgi:release factor glutamine methyltransferase
MIIKISPDLKKQEIWANGPELANIMGQDRVGGKRVLSYPPEKKILVHTFQNPILMTDNYRISKLAPTLRDTLFALYSSRPRVTEYDQVSISWDHSHVSVWCPSIDTILFAKVLKKILQENKFKTAVEIGTGSGFLSKFILEKSQDIESMLIIDLNPHAIKCSMENIKDKRALFYTGDGLEKIRGTRYDLIICNPPYIPRPNSIDDNPYEGIELLNFLIHKAQDYLNPGGILVTNISSLCYNIVLKENPKLKLAILEKMHVPLKINNVLNNKEWLSFLETRGLAKESKEGYDYWQDIFIVMIENK